MHGGMFPNNNLMSSEIAFYSGFFWGVGGRGAYVHFDTGIAIITMHVAVTYSYLLHVL